LSQNFNFRTSRYKILTYIFFPHGATAPSGPGSPHDHDHTQIHHDQ
jgi:hypothetical protein